MSQGVRFVLDERFSPVLETGFRRLGFRTERFPNGTKDPVIIEDLAASEGPGIWVTQDLDSARDHRKLIEDAGISVAFVRGDNPSLMKTGFLTLSFMYRFQAEVAAYPNRYYLVREVVAEGRPRAVVARVVPLDEIRGPTS